MVITMNYNETFLYAIKDKSSLPKGVTPSFFIGTPYLILEETENKLLTILSGGTVEVPEEFVLPMQPLDCRMLLYTKKGCGTLRLPKKTYQLEAGSLLYLDCSISPEWEIEMSEPGWQYTVFFIKGDQLSYYESLIPFSQAVLITVSSYSIILPSLEKLLQQGNSATLRNKLVDASVLNSIITELWIEAFHMEAPERKCPSYLIEIKQTLDTFFMNPLRLDDLESKYHISKYRICREFSSVFGIPPLKYLNKRRMEIAKNLLLSTDKHIHEIASELGYENTNHFINLFKKETGLTPMVYRDTISS